MPSILNRTLLTPTLSEAVAVIGIKPDTVLPGAGAPMLTVGGTVSGAAFWTITDMGADVVALPAASRAIAVIE
jgi:hypothetical protein